MASKTLTRSISERSSCLCNLWPSDPTTSANTTLSVSVYANNSLFFNHIGHRNTRDFWFTTCQRFFAKSTALRRMDCAIRKLCFGRHEIAHAGIRNFCRAKYSREKFDKDSNSLTHQQLDSQKWAEEGRKRNYYRLSLPSFPPPFSRALHFRVFPNIWEPGTGYPIARPFSFSTTTSKRCLVPRRTLPMVPCSSSPVTRVSRSPLPCEKRLRRRRLFQAPATQANFLRLYKCILSGAIKFVSVRSL